VIEETKELLEWKKVHLRCLEVGDHRTELKRIDGRTSVHGALIMQTIAAIGRVGRDEQARRRAARTNTKRQGRPRSCRRTSGGKLWIDWRFLAPLLRPWRRL
jgi:hypothetical protein